MMAKHKFSFYWLASSSIALADVVYIMVITTYMYQESGSAFIAALFPLFNASARFVAGFTAPLVMDKYNHSKLLMALQICKAALLTLLVVLFPYIASHVFIICLFILLIAFTEGWGSPLIQSLVPRIVPAERLVKANSTLSVMIQTIQIAGYTFTGYIVIRYGHMSTLIITCCLLWVAAICLWHVIRDTSAQLGETSGKAKPTWEAIKEGWAIIWNIPTLRMVTLMDAIEGLAGTIWVGAITLVYVKEVLGQSEVWWGYINSSYYVGAILGGLFTMAISSLIQKNLIACMVIGSALFSLLTLWYGLNSTPTAALALCIAMGPAYSLRDVAQQTAFQTSVDPSFLPKVYASRSLLLSTITSISIAVIGFFTDTLGIRMVYIVGAACIALSAMLSFTLLRLQKNQQTAVEADGTSIS